MSPTSKDGIFGFSSEGVCPRVRKTLLSIMEIREQQHCSLCYGKTNTLYLSNKLDFLLHYYKTQFYKIQARQNDVIKVGLSAGDIANGNYWTIDMGEEDHPEYHKDFPDNYTLYFESKHKLLIYLTSWYWCWLEYQFVIETYSVADLKTKITKALKVVTRTTKEDSNFSHINEVLLNQIIINENSKSYLTKSVDSENKEGLFMPYKRLVRRLSDIIIEYNRVI